MIGELGDWVTARLGRELIGGVRDQFPAQFPNQSLNQLPNYPITQLPDSRLASSVGRSARLELHFEARGGRTILARAYAEPPFRIGHTFDVDGAAYVILVCASPGVFAGDRFEQRVTVGPGARVLLVAPSRPGSVLAEAARRRLPVG